MEYPYYRLLYRINKSHIKKLVKTFEINIMTKPFSNFIHKNAKKYENEYVIIIDKWDDNLELNQLTDYFTEPVRIRCKFGNNISPLEYYQKYKNKHKMPQTIKEVIEIRETIYNNLRNCNNFRVSVVLTILKLFDVKKYLDISAGWGDRLLASLLFGVKLYCGVDPNKDLHKYYDEMIKTFTKNKERFILIEDGFETAKLPDDKFDMVFSSPPFFDLEKYSNYDNDSITKYKTEKVWCDNFLMVSIHKAYEYLENDGHMILYIHSSPYIDKQLKKLETKMKYKGQIYFFENKLRGLHVWQKKNT
jgi:16S rRNA G966 N2-methylase RsmD